MDKPAQSSLILSGRTTLHLEDHCVSGEYVHLDGESYYKIHNYDAMPPFFMSLISSSDHWMFIASTGGLTAGRVNAERALFPYYTVDKINENNENTGHKAILLVSRPDGRYLWEPFSERQRGQYALQRNLYKNISGSALVFEEVNTDLDLTYRYAWRFSDRYGFVKTTWLIYGNSAPCDVELVDGLQNLLPANISSQTQNIFSNLLDAYKRGEIEPQTGLGIFALSSNLTDLAEPSEALLANTVAQVGLEKVEPLLCSLQLDTFRRGGMIMPEYEVRGQRSAYLVHTWLHLEPGARRSWHLIAEVAQDHVSITALLQALRQAPQDLSLLIEADIAENQANLLHKIACADGLQHTQSAVNTAHHFANVLFNLMRGGIFAEAYTIQVSDFREFIAAHSPGLLQEQAGFFAQLPGQLQLMALQRLAGAADSPDLRRLCATYLPLTFSRRHGDPSRPWNRFSIHVKKPDGSQRLEYEGNWRDIFQNWEALAWSYPEFIENMLSTFLNATTVDGYNPYRITRLGVDWETPNPTDPWANIGYWSDHQIVYLQKLMEISTCVHPGRLQQLLATPMFSYANVPYRIKPYPSLLHDPYNTIEFDWELQREIDDQVPLRGTDARLVQGPGGGVFHTTLGEKLLTLLLAKLANFVPEGGIWMNTQRPEWNDANNALVGKGLSVVTLCYLRSFLVFCKALFAGDAVPEIPVRREVAVFFENVATCLARFQPLLAGSFTDAQRRDVLDALGQAGSDYRAQFYQEGITDHWTVLTAVQIIQFFELAQAYIDHSLRANRRADALYHAYNILHLREGCAGVGRLVEMLEGQVAILSSGLLTGEESLALLNSLRRGPLYRADQHSYILYPDRDLPGFLEKNRILPERVRGMQLVQALVEAQDPSLFTRDLEGIYHFSGQVRNIKDVNHALDALSEQPRFADLVGAEAHEIRSLFEEVFHHNQFTGRSSTFFAYEGLGSIYWHMVSKLMLAVQGAAERARREAPTAALVKALAEKYHDIRQGLGYRKPPQVFGAFPTDPYSHTPRDQGAKQPGMTGQVKEEVLTRRMELGLFVRDGQLYFDPFLLDPEELLTAPAQFNWLDVTGQWQAIDLEPGSLAFTFCQVPVILQASSRASMEVYRVKGEVDTFPGQVLDRADSRHIFERDGSIHHLRIGYASGV